MSERVKQNPNIALFMDLLRRAKDDPFIAETLHNSNVVLLPTDDPKLSIDNYNRAKLLPIKRTIFIEASKSEGALNYDTFEIKEPPIKL